MTWLISYDSIGFVRLTCQGPVTVKDCKACIDSILSHECWKPDTNILIDCLKNDLNGVTTNDFRAIGSYQAANNTRYGSGKMALLMNSTRDFGMGRLYELLNEPIVSTQIMVFRSEEDAVDWLASQNSGALAA